MNTSYLLFRKVYTKAFVSELTALFKEHSIEFMREDGFADIDPAIPNKELKREYILKLKKEDFEQAEKLISQLPHHDVDE
ncbi:MAG: hypothetical protein JWO06_2534 [Bacteroidota bacterium]|nr:hypothetical protein [Bacteroidota bacterium]